MSVMGDIAAELDMSWQRIGKCIWRELPDGQHAIICETESSCSLYVNGREIFSGESLPEAIVAAGSLARVQLRAMMADWSAPWGER